MLTLGSLTIKPWYHVEVPIEEMVGEIRDAVRTAKDKRQVDVHLVIGGKPVDQKNETAALSPAVKAGGEVKEPETDQRSRNDGSVVVLEKLQ